MEKSSKKWWQSWIKPERLVPLATVIGAFIALLLAALGILTVSVPEGVMLSLLALLAADALVERMGILERIQRSLELMNQSVKSEPHLVWEPDMFRDEPFENYLKGANELFVSGGSLIGLFREQREVIERWLSQTPDAKLRLILVDPKLVREGKLSVESLYRDTDNGENEGRELYARETERALGMIASLQKSFPGKIEVRLTKETPSVTVMMVDRSKARVSVNLYRIYPTQRPAFILSKTRHPTWFRPFEERYYIELWSKSKSLA